MAPPADLGLEASGPSAPAAARPSAASSPPQAVEREPLPQGLVSATMWQQLAADVPEAVPEVELSEEEKKRRRNRRQGRGCRANRHVGDNRRAQIDHLTGRRITSRALIRELEACLAQMSIEDAFNFLSEAEACSPGAFVCPRGGTGDGSPASEPSSSVLLRWVSCADKHSSGGAASSFQPAPRGHAQATGQEPVPKLTPEIPRSNYKHSRHIQVFFSGHLAFDKHCIFFEVIRIL